MNKQLRQQVYDKFNGLCAYTGKLLGSDWQVDHVEPQCHYRWHQVEHGNKDDISNLLPAIKIINHYKRGKNLDLFRKSMLTFHMRLKRLPKKTQLDRTRKRIIYMQTIADLFDITVDKPFSGKFYFEK
jgi:hypothetical protein